MARRDGGKTVFENKEDCEVFLYRLGEACDSCGWRVHAWVLMDNHFHLSIEQGVASHARLAQICREHGSVENKSHWRRDATRWREDRSAPRKPAGAKNLSLLRGAILALIPQEKFTSLNAAFD